MSSESYTQIMKNLTDVQLQDYLKNIDDFHPEAIIAAISETRKRKGDSDFLNELEQRIKAKVPGIEIKTPEPEPIQKEPEIVQEEEVFQQEVEQEQEGVDTPPLYTKLFIFIVSIIVSPVIGGILLAMNFARTNHKQEVYRVVGFIVSYIIIFSLVGNTNPTILIFLQIGGAYLLEELFWVRVYGRYFKHKTRPIKKTAIILGIIILIMLLIQSNNLPQ